MHIIFVVCWCNPLLVSNYRFNIEFIFFVKRINRDIVLSYSNVVIYDKIIIMDASICSYKPISALLNILDTALGENMINNLFVHRFNPPLFYNFLRRPVGGLLFPSRLFLLSNAI